AAGPLPPPPENDATRKRGFGRNAWIAIGVIGALLAVLVGLGIFAMVEPGSSARDGNRERTASNDEEEGEEAPNDSQQAAADVQFFMPGQWRTTSWINELDAPGLPDAAREQMLQQLNASRTTGEQCISPEDAANPQAGFFNLDQGGSCASAEPYIANGRIELAMSCTAAGLPAPTNLSIEGSYTSTEFTLNLTMTTEVAQAGTITMRGVATGEHLGDCGQARE
ncbi:MAG: DUF3617 domain-containing protein, partial [Sphingomonadaceae bacterium]|nr:DUF3617 domain-containing protein [Sphingomonadaceae bacterium]